MIKLWRDKAMKFYSVKSRNFGINGNRVQINCGANFNLSLDKLILLLYNVENERR